MVQVSVPDPKLELSEQPKSAVTGAVFNRPLPTGIGQGLEQLGQGADALATDVAKQQAQTDVKNMAVTLDANGVPQVANSGNSIILGQAGQDYQAAVAAGTKSKVMADVSAKIQDLHQQYATDPDGFAAASKLYTDALRNSSAGPEVGNALASYAQNEAQQRHANIQEKVFEINTKDSLNDIQTDIGNTQNKLQVMARQGAMNTPQYDQLQDHLQDRYDSLTGNILFGYSQDRADSELATAMSTNQGEAVVGQVDSIFKRTGGDGGRAGAQAYLDSQIRDNPDLQLSIQQRDQLYRQGMGHLAYLTSDQKAAIDANRVNSDKLIESFKSGKSPDPAVVNQALIQAQSLGDAESVMKIQAYASQAKTAAPYAGLNDEQRLRTMTGGGGDVAGASGRGLINAPYTQPVDKPAASGLSPQALYSFYLANGATKNEALTLTGAAGSEGVYNPQAIHDGGIGYGLFGHNGARLDAMRQSAGSFTPSWQQQALFSLKELRGRPEGAAVNVATSADQLADAQMAYEQPRAYTAANPRAGENYTGRLNTIRYLSQNLKDAPSISAGGAMAGPNAPTQAQMAANPFVMSAYLDSLKGDAKGEVSTAKNVGEALVTAFSQGQTPAPETVAAFYQTAAKHPDQLGEIGQKLQTQMTGASAGAGAAAMPAAQAQAYMQQVTALQHQPGAPLSVLAAADAAQKSYAKSVENLKKDPFGEAAHRGWIQRPPAPLDLSNPQTTPQAIAERGQAASAIGSFTGVAATPAFAPSEAPALKSVMTSGPIDQRLALVGAIANSGMPEPVMKATLAQLAGQKETLPLAVAGSVFRDSPDTARGIIQGQAIMQADPKFAPPKADFPTELSKAISFNDFPQTTAREGIAGAVRAYYAKLSADANDTTGVLDADRVKASIDAVTGGVLPYRGSSIVAPWYGAGQSGLDGSVRALTDADFAGARTANGEPFPASALQPSFANSFTWNNWRLQSAGDGKYLVFSGADDKRQYLGDSQGGKFVLDLGAKRGAVESQRDAGATFQPQSRLTTMYNSALMGGGN